MTMGLSPRVGRYPLSIQGVLLVLSLVIHRTRCEPQFPPYIAYRSPASNETLLLSLAVQPERVSQATSFDRVDQKTCPGVLKLGISKRMHDYHENNPGLAIRQPVVLHHVGALAAAHGGGKQVVYVTQYEHLDVLHSTPLVAPGQTIQNALVQGPDFPLLLESSGFHASPIVHDVNGDGIEDAIVADYDGGIYVMGLQVKPGERKGEKGSRHFHRTQVPRLYVRRDWVLQRKHEILGTKPPEPPKEEKKDEDENKEDGDEEKKEKDPIHDPYHSYFEYYYASSHDGDSVLRGVTADILHQNTEQSKGLTERRSRRVQHYVPLGQNDGEEDNSGDSGDGGGESVHRRLTEVESDGTQREHHEEQQHEEHHDVHQDERHDEHHEEHRDEHHDEHKEEHHDEHHDEHKEEHHDEHNAEHHDEHHDEHKEEHHEEHKEEHHDEHKDEHHDEHKEEHHGEHHDEHHGAHSDPKAHGEVYGMEHHESKQEHAAQEENTAKTATERRAEEHGDDLHDDLYEADDAMDDLMTEGDHVLDDDAFENLTEEDLEKEKEEEAEEQKKEEAMGYDGDDDWGHQGSLMDDPDYGMKERDYDDYHHYEYDDVYGGYNDDHNEYYDAKHYIRLPPHILSPPVLAELPKLYGNTDEKEEMLFVAVSYYFDEDEYEGFASYKRFKEKDHGDETELQRGHYVGSAIMSYVLGDSNRWSGQTHLDLSTDWSAPENYTLVGELPVHPDMYHTGAFALSSPTVADIDGDERLDVLLGTSMGIVYNFDARSMAKRDNWPVQMPNPVESRILVEDVVGDTNLEVFVNDIASNIVCLRHDATRIWNRNLALSFGHHGPVAGSTPMTMGDVNGDGKLDIVMVIHFNDIPLVFALEAATGKDLPGFPIMLDKKSLPFTSNPSELHHKLAQPLLVDLHADQSFLQEYLRRNGTHWNPQPRPRGGPASSFGDAAGLHIVQPLGEDLYVIEGGSGCSHKIPVGNEVVAMVQVDDVHGKDRLDLVVATTTGKVVTFETPAPFHPLNTWNSGELRSRTNALAHGYSASQGIFVHEQSRQYTDVFGVVVPITFEIFDNRPNIANEPDKRVYKVEIRAGSSSKRALFRGEYKEPGVYTERVYIRFGPGYYAISVVMYTSHGLVYEDNFAVGYNINFLHGLGVLLWLPLVLSATAIFLCGAKKAKWDDEDFDNDRNGTQGILGRALPS